MPDRQVRLCLLSVTSLLLLSLLNQGRLLDAIGKVLTPLLVLLLIVLAAASWRPRRGACPLPPVSIWRILEPRGLLEGYNTMDTFGALMFGMLIIDVLKQRDYRQLATDSLSGACWADLGCRATFVYISLFQLGLLRAVCSTRPMG